MGRTTDPRQLAEEVRGACLRAALEAYEQAGIAGLCESGRWDFAMDAVKALDLEALIERSAAADPPGRQETN